MTSMDNYAVAFCFAIRGDNGGNETKHGTWWVLPSCSCDTVEAARELAAYLQREYGPQLQALFRPCDRFELNPVPFYISKKLPSELS